MTKILAIESYDTTDSINLIDDSNICVFVGEGGNRPLKATDGTITRSFSFRVTASTNALARTAVNDFIAALRLALTWAEDESETVSYFLKEAADGETAVRSLILNWDATARGDGSAIDAYQTMNTVLYIDVALTLQDHREEAAQTILSEASPTAKYAVGASVVLYGSEATTKSRVSMDITSTLSGSLMRKLWVGMKKTTAAGLDFQPIWYFDYASQLNNGTAETTIAGSYGTNIVKTSTFSTTTMLNRVELGIFDQYNSLGVFAATEEAAGRYVVLIRYKVDSGTGSILVRAGVANSDGAPVSYNEARLVDGSGNWRFLNAGVIQFPATNARAEGVPVAGSRVAAGLLYIDAQRLSGTSTIVFDTVTMVPYDHYMEVDETLISTLYTADVYVAEDLQPHTYAKTKAASAFVAMGNIVDKNNFMYPVAPLDTVNRLVRLVIAGEREDVQIYNDDLDNGTVSIFEAFEAYNV